MTQIAGIDWDVQPLGKMPDTELAKQLGVRTNSVRTAREIRHIPPFQSRFSNRPDIDWDSEPLGMVPDREIAERLGVHLSSVRNARRSRKIQCYQAIGRLFLRHAA